MSSTQCRLVLGAQDHGSGGTPPGATPAKPTLFLNETAAIHGLYQFDAPSSPEKWERIWTEVEAA